MKNIEIDEMLYQYIASNTQYIGESASSILRRLLALDSNEFSASEPLIEETNAAVSVELSVGDKPKHLASAKKQVKTIHSVFDHINKAELLSQRGAVGRFLLILAALYRVHADTFSSVCEIRGRDRLYFAKTEEELAESGSSTKPRQIPESPYWVITNSNTTRKKMMLTEVAIALGYSATDTESIRDLL